MSPTSQAIETRLIDIEGKVDKLSTALLGDYDTPGRITQCADVHSEHSRRIVSLEDTRRIVGKVLLWTITIVFGTSIATFVGFKVTAQLTQQPSFQENVVREAKPWTQDFTPDSTTMGAGSEL